MTRSSERRAERRAAMKRNPAKMREIGMVHFQVADTAKALCGEYWEQSATRSNQFYDMWPDRETFVETNWSDFISIARQTLIDLLAAHDTPEEMKAQSHEAILKDQSVNVRRMGNPDSKLVTSQILSPSKETLQ